MVIALNTAIAPSDLPGEVYEELLDSLVTELANDVLSNLVEEEIQAWVYNAPFVMQLPP